MKETKETSVKSVASPEARIYRVYMLVLPNGKRYVGMTRNTLRQRCSYGSGYRDNPVLFADIHKFGWKNVTCVEDDNDGDFYTRAEAEAEESRLIALWRTTEFSKGYNKESGGLSNFVVHPDSIAGTRSAKFKPVIQYTKEGEFVDEYVSVLDASRITGILHATIARNARGEITHAGPFVWKYKEVEVEA